MDLKDKKVMVVGTGISGTGAIDLLNKVGADCIIYDGNEKAFNRRCSKKSRFRKMRNLLFCRLSTVSCQQPMEINFCKLILKQHKP